MKIVNYEIPKSSFLSIQKDLGLITNKILKNERLKRLLYYTTSDALMRPKLTEEESIELFNKHIKIIPRLQVDDLVRTYIIIVFNNFVPNDENPEFRNNTITFHIICHYDQWHLQDFQLRPYLIAGELDSMFEGKHLTGIGELAFVGCDQTIFNDNYVDIALTYLAIHGEEDRRTLPKTTDNEQFIAEFNEVWNGIQA